MFAFSRLYRVLFALSFVVIVSSTAKAYEWGLGLQAGHGWGLSMQKRSFADGSLNLGLNEVRIQVDYIRLLSDSFEPMHPEARQRVGQFVLYYGVGAEVTSGFTGLRLPLGGEYTFKDIPMVGFAAVVPILSKYGFFTTLNVGVRYLF